MLDDIAFLQRLLEDGAVTWAELLAKAEKRYTGRYGQVMIELSIQLGRSLMHPPMTSSNSTQCKTARRIPPVEQLSEADEVHAVRRCVSIRRAGETPTSLSRQQTESAVAPKAEAEHPWGQLASVVRTGLADVGLRGEQLERAISISLHCCWNGGIVGPGEASSITTSTAEDIDWASDSALEEFAYGMAQMAECEW